MRNKALLLSICLLLSSYLNAQTKREQELTLLGYNVLFGTVLVLGDAILKDKKITLKNIFKGALGGFTIYAGKKSIILHTNHNVPGIVPKSIHSLGYSMIDNTMNKRKLFQRFTTEIGFVRIELERNKSRLRLNPFALFAFGSRLFEESNRFNLKETLKAGTPMFYNREEKGQITNRVNSIAYYQTYLNNDTLQRAIISHELIHSFQNFEYTLTNNLISKQVQKKLNWKFIYFDQRFVFRSLYNAEKLKNEYRFSNFFEFEAEYFAKNRLVIR